MLRQREEQLRQRDENDARQQELERQLEELKKREEALAKQNAYVEDEWVIYSTMLVPTENSDTYVLQEPERWSGNLILDSIATSVWDKNIRF